MTSDSADQLLQEFADSYNEYQQSRPHSRSPMPEPVRNLFVQLYKDFHMTPGKISKATGIKASTLNALYKLVAVKSSRKIKEGEKSEAAKGKGLGNKSLAKRAKLGKEPSMTPRPVTMQGTVIKDSGADSGAVVTITVNGVPVSGTPGVLRKILGLG